VFYPVRRVGLDGRIFRMIKFRNHGADANELGSLPARMESNGVLFKIGVIHA